MSKEYFQNLKKAFQANNTWYPESSDKDGQEHPEKPHYVKHTAVNGKPVWKYSDQVAAGHEQAFMDGYKRFRSKAQISPKGTDLLHSLIRSVVKDPDKHVIASGTTPGAPEGHHEMRLRHLGAAMSGKHGYQIHESDQGLHITAPRHSGSSRSNIAASQWTWNGQDLQHTAVNKNSSFGKSEPISSYNQQGGSDANQRTTRNSSSESLPGGRRVGSRRGGSDHDGKALRKGRHQQLNKGSARRLHGKFDQTKELTEDEAQNMRNWVKEGDPSQREDIPEASAGAKHRILNKLMSRTQSRKNPETNQVELLLHRQMGPWEVEQGLNGKTFNHNKDHSSWTYDLDRLRRGIYSRSAFFMEDPNYNHIVSAWVPSSHIHSMPIQYGSTGTEREHEPGSPSYSNEGEVIIKPNHNSQVHDILHSDNPTEWDFKPKLAKGLARKRWPYDPIKEDVEARQEVEDWTGGYNIGHNKGRDYFKKLTHNALQRGLHKLHGMTEVRRGDNGQREFLLHRGGMIEDHDGPNINHRTSWTPDKEVALEFGQVKSAWIPESQIHHIPNAIGSASPDFDKPVPNPVKPEHMATPHRREEHEVIVNHHDFDFVDSDKPTNQSSLNARINQRQQKLNKGSARRLHGKFDQTKELTEDEANNMRNWVGGGDRTLREDIPEASAGAKHRILNKLMGRTKSRRNPETNQIEFLLHRQMGSQEIGNYLKGQVINHHDSHSSWTYNENKIREGIYDREDLSDEAATNYNHVVSAWIPSSHIHSMPTQYGGTGTHPVYFLHEDYKPEYVGEGEVVVKPNHNSQVHDILHSDHPTEWQWKPKLANMDSEKPTNQSGLNTRINQRQQKLGKAIVKSLGYSTEIDTTAYWSMVIPDSFYENSPILIKAMRIRTKGRVFVALDGDNIGASVERAAMADDLDTIISQSEKIAAGQKAIRDWAESNGADIYIDGGDDIAFTLPEEKVEDLDELRRIYNRATGFTVTIGVGETISKAGHAMLYGKLNGKDQVNEWVEDIDEFLAETSRKLTPEEKLADHGLLPGGIGDSTSISDVDRDELRQGIRHEMEHTDDPQVAVEIALDHLTEDPQYYTNLKDLEKGLKGDWEKEGYQWSGYEFEHDEPDRVGHKIVALDRDHNMVGEYNFSYDPKDNTLTPDSVWTHEHHRRKGLANEAYRQAEIDTNRRLTPASAQSPEAQSLWDNPGRSFGRLHKNDKSNRFRELADQYASTRGLKLDHDAKTRVNPEKAGQIAQAYHEMKHDPHHPKVQAAYGAMIQETLDQFKHLKNSGLKVSRIEDHHENPYPGGSKDMLHDLHNNNHLWFYPTESGFGSKDGETPDHPLLQPTDEHHEGKPLLANDVFRIVHDVFGHGKEGTTFGPHGEENAWEHHMQMYSPLAQKALTSETRGQNSWVNFGPHGDHNRKNPAQTVYADQKAGLLPDWASESNITPKLSKSDDHDYLDLVHFSNNEGLDTLTPNKQGTAKAGKEHQTLSSSRAILDAQNREYTKTPFLHTYTANSGDAESIFRSAPAKYHIRMPKDKIYDLGQDKMNIFQQVKEENSSLYAPNEHAMSHPDLVHRKIKDAGYLGFNVGNHPHPRFRDAVMFYHDIPVMGKDHDLHVHDHKQHTGLASELPDHENWGSTNLPKKGL